MKNYAHPLSKKLISLLFIAGALAVLGGFAKEGGGLAALAAGGAVPDPIADRVLGQPAFNFAASGSTAGTLNQPAGVAVAPSGRLFVADYKNNRILSWSSATGFTTGQAADLVIGKPNFTEVGADPDMIPCPAPSAGNTSGPESVAVDATGNLYVADTYCHRVLIFEPPFTSGMAASMVLGQPDFTTGAGCIGPQNGTKFCYARGVSVDAGGNLFVADQFNHRVLQYNSPLTTDNLPDRVFGQPNLNTGDPNQGGLPGAATLKGPRATALDAGGNLYVADLENHRVLIYNGPLTTDATADQVLGQNGNFTTDIPNNGGVSASSLSFPVDLVLDSTGHLYVSDAGNHRVLVFETPLTGDTTADWVFGQNGSFTSATPNNGGVSPTGLNEPLGMAFDNTGRLYIADRFNNRVLGFNAPPALLLNVNLIQNGDAEATLGSSDGATFAPASWQVTQGSLTAVQYGASGGFPTTTDPGPANRGSNFFGGGLNVDNTFAEQQIDVSPLSNPIDQGEIDFAVSGYFGGFADQADTAALEINFKDNNGGLISQTRLGDFTAADRQNQTGLFLDEKTGSIPAGTREIQIILQMQRLGGFNFNDGYADNLSLVLTGPGSPVYLPLIVR